MSLWRILRSSTTVQTSPTACSERCTRPSRRSPLSGSRTRTAAPSLSWAPLAPCPALGGLLVPSLNPALAARWALVSSRAASTRSWACPTQRPAWTTSADMSWGNHASTQTKRKRKSVGSICELCENLQLPSCREKILEDVLFKFARSGALLLQGRGQCPADGQLRVPDVRYQDSPQPGLCGQGLHQEAVCVQTGDLW